MATSRDVREVISKLSSDKAKSRDEGVKLLSSWLEGERSYGFCKLLARNTAKTRPGDMGAETWPFLINLLTKCIALEISSSKKRAPKLILAKTLRTAIQCAEDPKLSGQRLLLFSVVKTLFNHIWEVTREISSFQSEYSSILRNLLTIKEYKYQLRKKTYCSLVILFMNKIISGIQMKSNVQAISKEDLFRSILTLHVLLENPPGDFPDNIRSDVITGFCEIFTHVRDEGKISRKLMECVNIFLIKDGPNLGFQVMEIHSSLKDFMFRCWLTTHDRSMKSIFINYGRVILRLNRGNSEGGRIVEQFLDVIIKELDQSFTTGSGTSNWAEMQRDEKVGSFSSIQEGLMDLSATVFYQACKYIKKASNKEKRLKMESPFTLIKDGLLKGSFLWSGTVSYLIRNFGSRLEKTLLIQFFEASCQSLKRILSNANPLQFEDTLLWLLRALQEFSSVLRPSKNLSLASNEISKLGGYWQDVWSSLMHGLPIIFSTNNSAVDPALVLLANMILRDQVGVAFVPQDVWDLRTFNHMPSVSALYFIACFFSRTGFQGDISGSLLVRKKLLRATLELVNLKEPANLNDKTVILIPQAIFSLSAGSASSLSSILLEGGEKVHNDEFEYSVEALSELRSEISQKIESEKNLRTHLPKLIKQPLIAELMDYFEGFINSNTEFTKIDSSVLIYICSLLCNIIYSALISRLSEDISPIIPKLSNYISEIINHLTSLIKEKSTEIQSTAPINTSSTFDSFNSTLSSLKTFLSSPLFNLLKQNTHSLNFTGVLQSLDALLLSFSHLFEAISVNTNFSGADSRNLPTTSLNSDEQDPLTESKHMILDLELDAGNGSDFDGSGSINPVSCLSPLIVQMNLVSVFGAFFSVLPNRAWDVLYSLVEKQNDDKVYQSILLSLCQHMLDPAQNLSSLVQLIEKMLEESGNKKLNCFHCINAIDILLRKLLSLNNNEKQPLSEKDMSNLSGILNKIAESDVPDWSYRAKLVDCISSFISLDPDSGQVMIEPLLAMLHDHDYRVRLILARKISLLFQTWDGHNELFHDICLNFGVQMARFSSDKPIKARQVLNAGPQPIPLLETALITLAHLSLFSEDIEVDCVFMMCAVAAIEPSQRDLTYSLFDNLSKQLNYESRTKYLEQVVGSILYRWVACDVSLVSLVEVQNLFQTSDPKNLVEFCCPWLLPPLILKADFTSLNWISKVSGRSLSGLIKEYFVPIFAVLMAVHCSEKTEKEIAGIALSESLLQFGEISEIERDELIKRHLVSIVGFLFSLTSASPNPEMPYFTSDIIVISVKTIVDGFMEMDDNASSVHIVDKINIFRADRVFKFLVEMHYQISAATHPRHVKHKISAINVLIDVLGHRVIMPSSSFYIVSIVGNLIAIRALQDQCCAILSKLIQVFNSNHNKEIVAVLGEQLQFVVSKLVDCCIPLEEKGEKDILHSSGIVPLLHKLTVDADLSLHDYIKELEPFPSIKCLEKIRSFHNDLSSVYSPKDQFLKFVKRATYLPPRLFFLSLERHHKNLISGNLIERGSTNGCWYTDSDFVSAVWALLDLSSSNHQFNSETGSLAADFLSRVGICDPHRVVFSLPNESCEKQAEFGSSEANFYSESGISEDLLIQIVRLLKKYLSDDSVKIVDVTSQTLRGILSTEKGQNVLRSLDSHERSLIEVHSKGVNMAIVEKLLLDYERSSNASFSVENSSLWQAEGKTYDTWVCSLVHSLIAHCNDTILRLCQNIVLLKAEIAELLLASVLVSLARKSDSNSTLCDLISTKLKENIFVETNNMEKSIQVFLDALNKVRSFFITERAKTLPSTPKASTSSKPVRTSERTKDKSPKASFQFTNWEKVYWLSIDYLEVAKASMRCASYFTAVVYVELWCEEHFNALTLGSPDFSYQELLPPHIDLLIAAYKQINEPDSIYGVIQTNKMASQIARFEHEGNWSKSLEYYDLLARSAPMRNMNNSHNNNIHENNIMMGKKLVNWESNKGLMRSLQKTGCTHILDTYCQGLTNQNGFFQHDPEFIDIQYEAAWRAGNWDFSFFIPDVNSPYLAENSKCSLFNENLHSCLRALKEGDDTEFPMKLKDAKKNLVSSLANASKESTKYIHSSVCRLQILDHINMAWDLRWTDIRAKSSLKINHNNSLESVVPSISQIEPLNEEWRFVLQQTQLHLDLLEPFIAFRRVLLQILDFKDCTIENLLQSASALRKGSRFSLAAAALYELKELCCQTVQGPSSHNYFLARLEEAKLLRAEGQHDMAVSLGRYIIQNYPKGEEISNVYRLVGKWLAETRSSNSRTIIEQYLKQSVDLTESRKKTGKYISRQCQTYFHIAHYTDGLFKSYEERLASSEWQSALRLRKHKTKELDALIKRLRSSSKGEKTDYSVKIQELQKQLTMDKEEAQKLQDDRDNFLRLALEGYQRSLIIGGKYDLRVVFRLVSLWFNLFTREHVVESMRKTIKEVQSYKFIPLVYQIASRLGSSKDAQGSNNFQSVLVSLVKKMAIDHPYHTMFQLLALANGDRVKDKQRSRSSFIVDIDKKLAAENILNELSSYHGPLIRQMKVMVEAYIKLAELETRKEDTNKKITLPRDVRSLRQLELVPIVTATIQVDPSCQYKEGSFPHFKGFADSIMVMNGINAPKVVECYGSDGKKYRQLAKSGNDDLRQDAVMEQFFSLVNMFLQNHRDAWKRRLGIRTYKVVPFTPSAGLVEWVDRTIPLGEYLLGSTRCGGAHARYGVGDWSFLQCREHMSNEKDKKKAFLRVCDKFRPVMHHFFSERFLQPADWFGSRLAYTRSVAASSMVGYIVGLGDRHSMNILIDQETAEVVHIDLGVAFEQGLMLKTPERVPFRLTRDMIDGMGVTGVEGVFRRCCEETLSVMRANKEALLTIIEVFIHDPLYKWALSPLKALQRQKETDEEIESGLESSQEAYEGNKDAARASLRVKQKLDGYEDGEMRSVQGQVQQLIQDAVDIDRLCQMFPGWGAWL